VMKSHSVLLIAAALLVGACSPKRLSPVVLQEHAPSKPAPVKSPQSRPVVASSTGKSVVAKVPPASASRTTKSISRTAATSNRSKADEAARSAERKRKIAAARRLQMRKMAEASYEAGRQLLRENQTEPALRAFRESVRLNSHSPDAWMGVAYICEITGNTKDAVEAFRAAKRLWGM
jgi:Flp pilus assembly protein TadD